jgi:hypothetical protein
VAPERLWYAPAPQATQALETVMPTPVLYRPVPHEVHETAALKPVPVP